MKTILGRRRTGKTIKLIHASAERHAHIVVCSKREAGCVSRQAMEMNLDIPFPITFDEFLNRRYCGGNINGFLIDNADNLLRSLSIVPILAISITAETDEILSDDYNWTPEIGKARMEAAMRQAFKDEEE